MIVGVILKTVEAYSAFMQFRKEWYMPTKFILDARDIDSTLDYVVTDVPLGIQSNKLLVYGKDFNKFEELSKYVNIVRAIPFGTQHVIDLNRLQAVLPDVKLSDNIYEELCEDFKDIMFDSRDIPGLDFSTEGLTENEIRKQKTAKIAEVLAQRAKEKRDKEEALRLEAERVEQERLKKIEDEKRKEEERIAEQKRLEAEQRELELRAAKEEAEKMLIAAEHQRELARIQAEAEEKLRLSKLEDEREALAKKEKELQLEAEERAIEQRKAKLNSTNYDDVISTVTGIANKVFEGTLRLPNICGFQLPQQNNRGTLRIGRKSQRQSNIFVIGGAIKDCGSSTMAYNLAYTLSKKNPRTLLIDLDFNNASLTELFKTEDIDNCGVDVCFRGVPFEQYLNNIESYCTGITIQNRTVMFMNCKKADYYSPDNRALLYNFDYSKLLAALSTRFDNIVVDIGCIGYTYEYQRLLLIRRDLKNIVCYGASNTSEINESVRNIYNVKGNYNAVLAKAPSNINKIMIEKSLRRPVLGVIVRSDRFYKGCTYLYEDDDNSYTRTYWNDLLKAGGVR